MAMKGYMTWNILLVRHIPNENFAYDKYCNASSSVSPTRFDFDKVNTFSYSMLQKNMKNKRININADLNVFCSESLSQVRLWSVDHFGRKI